jgi:hypothetical protein
MSKKNQKNSKYDIPFDFDVFTNEDEVHAVPSDILEHELSYDCYCKPRLVNKFQASQDTERLVYIHHYMAAAVN